MTIVIREISASGIRPAENARIETAHGRGTALHGRITNAGVVTSVKRAPYGARF
jgi:hypothetical protein